ncbi:hypothetical protein [Empedobacter tilapiae]|uniref:DoxX family membrane protein n=1 Tax=Empedobacter tilapiae TaxID=2491114 RepID=A0A4Z1BA65_9FLAO|nr:hypothetical protein [Empedobacter tilapiae]TGN27258.1 hypothetical protein E4J94_08605 [Empedobacter tilapiae]
MKQKLIYILYWAAIFTVSISMFVYGIIKPTQFTNMDNNINNHLPEGHRLMWSFYSFTKGYPIIIGIFEVIGAITLLFRRTRIFGCLLLTSILVNIILQDYFYEIVALNSSIFYQVLIFVILIIDRERVIEIFSKLFELKTKLKPNWILIIISFILAIGFKFIKTKVL